MNKKIYPCWFNKDIRPVFNKKPPIEISSKRFECDRLEIWCGDILPHLEEGYEYEFDIEYDYDGSNSYYLIKYRCANTVNSNYKYELELYQIELQRHNQLLQQYDEWLVEVKKQEEKETVRKEKILLKKLKEKYDK